MDLSDQSSPFTSMLNCGVMPVKSLNYWQLETAYRLLPVLSGGEKEKDN
jgi:hypothetical protein